MMCSAWQSSRKKYSEYKDTEVLDVTMENENGKTEGIGRIGSLEKPMTLEECCVYVKPQTETGQSESFWRHGAECKQDGSIPGVGKKRYSGCSAKGGRCPCDGRTSDIMTDWMRLNRGSQLSTRDITGQNIFLSMT